MSNLLTQPNERPDVVMRVTHRLAPPACCPVSGNPQSGSTITISYTPRDCTLEVYALRKYVETYMGGRGSVRSMESMIQTIAADCASVLGVTVSVRADINIQREDSMIIRCKAHAS